MNKYDVIIIGGGAAGLSCGLLIASAARNIENCADKKILIIDSGFSDAKRAEFNNVSGISIGTSGPDLVKNVKKQIESYPQITLEDGVAKNAVKSDGKYQIEYLDKSEKERKNTSAEYLVLASGFRAFNLKGLNIETTQFDRSKKTSRVMIRHNDYKISPKLFVCGLLAGCSSQWDIAAGSGAQVGVHIISEWAGDWSVVHDKV